MALFQQIKSASPLIKSLSDYRGDTFASDFIAGLIVAIMLIPQAMAYAMLAGLPPQAGLYASIVPLILYALFGSSNYLAVGPVAMVSLLVLSGVGQLAEPGSDEFIQLCLTLALMVGVLQILMALFRLGFLVNFISHPVLVGFTSAAAIVIALSQLKHLLGISFENGESPIYLFTNMISHLGETNGATLTLGLASCVLLVFFCFAVRPMFRRLGINAKLAETISKVGPLVAVVIAALVVFFLGAKDTHSVAIVGEIPAGFPGFTFPDLNLSTIQSLLPLALTITLVGYMESFAVAKALASRRREKISANRELFALGIADIGAAMTGGYPVTGGFSRSMVNFSAGVRTPLGSIVTALLIAVSVLFLTPLFFYIPKAVLAAIIIVAVVPLIDFKTPLKLWKYSRGEAFALLTTFFSVFVWGIETGILVGVATTIVFLMWKMSQPHVAEVGRIEGSEHFRNVLRHDVKLTEGVLCLRIDESLNFANAPFLESYIMEQVSDRRDIDSVLLVSSGVNDIDSTGIDVLERIENELQSGGVGFYMSEVKGPVTDRLQLAGFNPAFLEKNIFLSTDKALGFLS